MNNYILTASYSSINTTMSCSMHGRFCMEFPSMSGVNSSTSSTRGAAAASSSGLSLSCCLIMQAAIKQVENAFSREKKKSKCWKWKLH